MLVAGGGTGGCGESCNETQLGHHPARPGCLHGSVASAWFHET